MKIEIDTESDGVESIRAIGQILINYATDMTSKHSIIVGGKRESITGNNPPVPKPPLPPPDAPAESEQAPPPPPTASTDSAELDANGLPWDMRIHASTKTKMKDGKWKYRRGLAGNVRQDVEAELKGAVPTSTTTATPVSESVTSVTTPSLIIARVSELRARDKLTDIRLAEICAECGIEEVAFIMGQNEETCAKFAALLEVDTV